MKRKIRRFLAVLLSTAMCLSLVACGDEVVITEDNTQNAQVTEVTEQQEPIPLFFFLKNLMSHLND